MWTTGWSSRSRISLDGPSGWCQQAPGVQVHHWLRWRRSTGPGVGVNTSEPGTRFWIGVLIVLNAGSEIALISLREGQLARLERRSARGRALAALARQPNRFLSTIQIGITLAGFLASATAAVALAEPLVAPLSFLGRAARPAAIFSITLALTFVTLVFGELAPKRLAMQRAESWALLAARPLTVLAHITAPAIWVLSHATDLAVRLIGAIPTPTDPARRTPDLPRGQPQQGIDLTNLPP
jgi:CBS domain containing-hemolysin-like protein